MSFILSRLQKTKEDLKKFVMRFLILIFTTSLLVTLSSLLYIFFYNLVIPRISVFAPLNFVFRDCGTKRCDYPTAFVDFSTPPFQFQFERGEHYKFVLDLLVPESPTNHDVGMFILTIEFIGKPRQSDHTLKRHTFKTEKKAAMLHYKSPIIQMLSSILYSPLLVYGLTEETQKITREVVSLYEEKPELSLAAINVIIESKRLNIYEGHLTIQTKLEGFRSFMYHYPIFSFMIGAPVFLVPVIAAFFSINSNSFEKKKKKLTAIILRSLEDDSSSETSWNGEEQLYSLPSKEKDVKDSDSSIENNEAFRKKSEESSPNDESSENETFSASDITLSCRETEKLDSSEGKLSFTK